MKIISPELEKFVSEIAELMSVGCVTVPQRDLPELIAVLNKSDQILSPEPQEGRVFFQLLQKPGVPHGFAIPAIFVVTEEDFSDREWNEKIRKVVSYFFNVRA